MENPRKYGKSPYSVALIHGGPGAPGSMAPVARRLSSGFGILEPLQTADSIDGQIEELKAILDKHAQLPVILVGASWGAWLSIMLSARHPELTKKLVLVSSGGFEKEYGVKTMETRLNRLSDDERNEVQSINAVLNDLDIETKESYLTRLGELFKKTDEYDPLDTEAEDISIQDHIFKSVWSEANQLRASGELLALAELIRCPVVAIHGDYDPHPAEGVDKPLRSVLKNFRFFLLKNCGHTPWNERLAQDEFFRILEDELKAE